MPQSEKLTQIDKFPAMWRKNNQTTQNIIAQLNDIGKNYENVPGLVKNVEAYKKMVLKKSRCNRNQLIAGLVKFYPETDSELLTIIRKLKKTESHSNSLYSISPLLARESIGELNIPAQYEPTAALQLFLPWSEVLQFEASESKKTAGIRLKNSISPEVRTTMQSYIDDYLKFWGTYPDSLTPPFNTWASFRNFCSKMKPYEVNSLLLAVYKSCSENIAAVPASMLTENQKKYRDNLLADIVAKTQMLTPHFSGICIRQVNSWSLLPQKPEEAFQFLHSRNDKKLLSDYLALVMTGNKGDIPWWSKFFNQVLPLPQNWPSSENWPDFSDLQRNNKLKNMTTTDLVTLIKNSKSCETLLKALEDKKFSKVPVFEISLSKETSQKLLAKYRCVEVILPGKKSQRITLQPGKVIASCALSTPGIKLKFYQFANASESVAQTAFSGKYAPLNLVMQKDRKTVGKASFQIPCNIDGETLFFVVTVK